MSHFTNMKTRFRNLVYLEKALNKLNIKNKREKQEIKQGNSKSYNTKLVIPQTNGYDIQFSWNENEYDLIVDMSFWKQPYPVENFISKVAQQYASEVIVGESQKEGFQPIKYRYNVDGSKTLVLERWSAVNKLSKVSL